MARDGIGPVWDGAMAGGEPLFLAAADPRRPLRLGEVQNALAVRLLQVVGQPKFGLAIDPAGPEERPKILDLDF